MSRRGVSAAATAAAAARSRRVTVAATSHSTDDESDADEGGAAAAAAVQATASAPCIVAPVTATIAATPAPTPAHSASIPSPPPSDWCSHCSSSGLLVYEASIGAHICVGCGHTHSASPLSTTDADPYSSSPDASSIGGATGNLVDDRVWDDASNRHVVQSGSFVRNDGTQMALSASAMRTYAGATSISKMARGAGGREHATALARQRAFRRAAQLLSLLRLPPNMLAQVCNMLEQLAASAGAEKSARADSTDVGADTASVCFSGGVAGDLLIASCAYALCRSRGRALSMMDVSDALSCSVHKFGRVFQSVCDRLRLHLRELDPTVFVERVLVGVGDEAEAEAEVEMDMEQGGEEQRKPRPSSSSSPRTPAPLSATVDDEMRAQLRHQSNTLLKLARRDWLQAGRTPAGLAGAAVLLALQSAGVDYPLASIAAALKVAPKTVSQRTRELKSALVDVARQTLPWILAEGGGGGGGRGGKGARRVMDAHLPFIMDNLGMLMQVQDAEADDADSAHEPPVAANSQHQQLAPIAAPLAPSPPPTPAPATAPPCTLTSLLGRGPTSSDPPSFKRLYLRRSSRLLRIARVVRRLEAASQGRFCVDYRAILREVDVGGVLIREQHDGAAMVPPSADASADAGGNNDADADPVALLAQPLDSEDLLLEKLLLAGVSPALLVDGSLAGLMDAHAYGGAGAGTGDDGDGALDTTPDASASSDAAGVAAPLNDADLSAAELDLYLRSDAEMQQMARLIRMGRQGGVAIAPAPALTARPLASKRTLGHGLHIRDGATGAPATGPAHGAGSSPKRARVI